MKFYVLIYLDGKSLAVKYEVKYIETAPGDIFNRKILIFIKIDLKGMNGCKKLFSLNQEKKRLRGDHGVTCFKI